MKEMTQRMDPWLRRVDELGPLKPGLTAIDVFRRSPGKHISRTWVSSYGNAQQEYQVKRGDLLCSGAGLVIGNDGLARHVQPWHPGRFGGFCLSMLEGDRVEVKTKGGLFLRLLGVQSADRGRDVFCIGPDEFTLDPKMGGPLMGVIAVIIPDQPLNCAVRFAGHGDSLEEFRHKQSPEPRRA